MAPYKVIDSHIHLWPESASSASPTGHSWMTPGMPLAKPHLLPNYLSAIQPFHPDRDGLEGVVYVETDRAYTSPPSLQESEFETWATGPLDEIKFIRSLVAADLGPEGPHLLRGVVLWAPMQLSTRVLRKYLRVAEGLAGPEAWKRVKGFRFLLQGVTDRAAFERLVLSEAFLGNLRLLGEKDFVFDIGVSQLSGGSWQLELIAEALEKATQWGKRVKIVLNHLCKPDFASSQGEEFERWSKAVARMAQKPETYMKLSGAFSELSAEQKRDTDGIVQTLLPWVRHILQSFGPGRVMFGSDWPVCNVGGPAGEQSWGRWKMVVMTLLDSEELALSWKDKVMVLTDTARKAYSL